MSVFDKIQALTFKYNDREDIEKDTVIFSSNRLSAQDFAELPEDTKDLTLLRCKLADYFQLKCDAKYDELEIKCDIMRDTFQKTINIARNRGITFAFLEKFCIGLGLTLEETKELFSLMGYILHEDVRRDKVLMASIEIGSTLDEYDEDLVKCGFPSIFRE